MRRSAPKSPTSRTRKSPQAPVAAKDVGPKRTGVASGVQGMERMPANAITVRTLITENRLKAALAMAEVVLKRYPDDEEVALQRARLLFWTGAPKKAEHSAVAIYRKNDRSFGALRLVGDIRQERGDVRGAIRAYREAQLRGDPDVRLAIRLIDMYLTIGDSALALAQVRPGMKLPDDLELRLANARHPWRAEVWAGMTSFNGQLWRRTLASATYTWSSRLALFAGFSAEDRGVGRLGTQASIWLFFDTGDVQGDIRAAWAPSTGGYLPPIDVWAEAAVRINANVAVGLWARYANYEVSPLYTIGPYVPLSFGKLSVRPGYLVVVRGPTIAGDLGQVGHTFFVRNRWQQSARTAFFAWLYYGQEVVFNNRSVYGPDESGPSVVLGWDQWFSTRFGLRLIGTAYHQTDLGATMWDLNVALRVRL
ncbi:MAG TPA: hypothetical protein DCQ06_07395 [Myxococcales bacterium]|nr:hypothetical protein [Myxococcales bacterium]HAN31406.1 hypothetical protein [Myxococcales bacterium]